MKMTNFWRGLAQEITQSDAVLDATEALAPKSLEAVDVPVDVAIYTHVYNVHGDYIDSIEGGEGLKASEIHFLPFTQPRDILGADMRVFVGLLHKHSFQRFMADRGLELLVSDSLLYNQWINSVDSNFSDYLLSMGVKDLSLEEMAAVNQLEIQDYYSLIDFYNGARIRNGKGTSLAAQIRACSAFYIGRKTVGELNEIYKRYSEDDKKEEPEYGGIMYVSTTGELLLEECKTCTPSDPTEKRMKGLALSHKYTESDSRVYVASWHIQPPSTGYTPSGIPGRGTGDVQAFSVPRNAHFGPPEDFSDDPSELPSEHDLIDKFVSKTYRISGAFGVILWESNLVLYRHIGPLLLRTGNGPTSIEGFTHGRYTQYGFTDDNVYDADNPAMGYIVYDIDSLDSIKLIRP